MNLATVKKGKGITTYCVRRFGASWGWRANMGLVEALSTFQRGGTRRRRYVALGPAIIEW